MNNIKAIRCLLVELIETLSDKVINQHFRRLYIFKLNSFSDEDIFTYIEAKLKPRKSKILLEDQDTIEEIICDLNLLKNSSINDIDDKDYFIIVEYMIKIVYLF